jgi:Fic family protein
MIQLVCKNDTKNMQTKNTTKRQDLIVSYIETQKSVSTGQIIEYIQKELGEVARVTISRDLDKLLRLGLLERQGAGRSIFYKPSAQSRVVKEIDVNSYFSVDADKREVIEKFNFSVFDNLTNIFTDKEKTRLAELNKRYTEKIKKITPEILKKEIERLNIDFSWKSSKIEGNTYDLLETEQLLKNQKLATGHSKEEAIMILNHKAALDYIREGEKKFQTISVKKIEEIHTILTNDLGVTRNLRKSLVRITGTKYFPLDNEFQIKEALEKTCELVNKTKNPFEKAVIVMLLIAYIQPFVDGNKRTSRLNGNAILQSFSCCPLSYRSMDELEYKKAILLFYEQNNISYFKKLFMAQFEFAVENYFG